MLIIQEFDEVIKKSHREFKSQYAQQLVDKPEYTAHIFERCQDKMDYIADLIEEARSDGDICEIIGALTKVVELEDTLHDKDKEQYRVYDFPLWYFRTRYRTSCADDQSSSYVVGDGRKK
jgi:hypothetical protein